MDCCGHEGIGSTDARFEITQVADGVHAAVAAPAYKVSCEAMRTKGLKRIQGHARQVPAEIARLRADLAAASTPDERVKLQADLRLAERTYAMVS